MRAAVCLVSAVVCAGILACLDGYMNIAMEQTEEYVNGECTRKYGDCFIRGNNGTWAAPASVAREANANVSTLPPSRVPDPCSARSMHSFVHQHTDETWGWQVAPGGPRLPVQCRACSQLTRMTGANKLPRFHLKATRLTTRATPTCCKHVCAPRA